MGYVRCVKNDGYEASLDIGKVYKTLPTTGLECSDGLIRVIDNEGEDYLYDSDYFELVELDALAEKNVGFSALHYPCQPTYQGDSAGRSTGFPQLGKCSCARMD